MRLTSTAIFIKPKTLRSLEEIKTDLLEVEREAEGLINELFGGLIG